MPGLGRRILGGALKGVGGGIIQQAQHSRQVALEELRQGRQDDRAEATRQHQTEMFGMRADRQDTQAEAGRASTDARAEADRTARVDEAQRGRKHRSSEAALDRSSRETTAGARAKQAAERAMDKPILDRTDHDGNRHYITVGEMTARMNTEKDATAKAEARAKLETAVKEIADEHSSMFDIGGVGKKDNASKEDVGKAVDLMAANPKLSPVDALNQAMQGRATGVEQGGAETGGNPDPERHPNAKMKSLGGKWYVGPDAQGKWNEVTGK